MLSRASLGAIWVYQQFMSPRKGFACAYRVAHGGTGCSGYAKGVIRDKGLLHGWPDIRARFAACKATALAMRADRDDDRPRKRRGDRCSWAEACLGCVPCGAAGASTTDRGGSGGGCDATSCDANPCDGCNGCDGCSGCSCSP